MEEKKSVIVAADADTRLDLYLKKQECQLSRTMIKDLILQGGVVVNGLKVKPHQKLKVNDRVTWHVPDKKKSGLEGENIPLEILFEDRDVLVLNKPSGLVVHPGAGNPTHTLVNGLLYHTQELSSINPQRPGIVHRLDKDTSGVMVVAKNNAAHLCLARQFKDHSIQRRYVALVEGLVSFDEGIVDVPIKRHRLDRKKMSVSYSDEARPAETFYKVLKRFPVFTALELFPQTGRTHQLRVHLAHLGHPVLGDPTYGNKRSFSRLALHAKDLGFTHPTTEKFVKFNSPLPPEMKDAIPGIRIS